MKYMQKYTVYTNKIKFYIYTEIYRNPEYERGSKETLL